MLEHRPVWLEFDLADDDRLDEAQGCVQSAVADQIQQRKTANHRISDLADPIPVSSPLPKLTFLELLNLDLLIN